MTDWGAGHGWDAPDEVGRPYCRKEAVACDRRKRCHNPSECRECNLGNGSLYMQIEAIMEKKVDDVTVSVFRHNGVNFAVSRTTNHATCSIFYPESVAVVSVQGSAARDLEMIKRNLKLSIDKHYKPAS